MDQCLHPLLSCILIVHQGFPDETMNRTVNEGTLNGYEADNRPSSHFSSSSLVILLNDIIVLKPECLDSVWQYLEVLFEKDFKRIDSIVICIKTPRWMCTDFRFIYRSITVRRVQQPSLNHLITRDTHTQGGSCWEEESEVTRRGLMIFPGLWEQERWRRLGEEESLNLQGFLPSSIPVLRYT